MSEALVPPVTRHQFLRAVPQTFAMPENQVYRRAKPRVSSLASCARQTAYMMAAVPLDDGREGAHSDRGLTQEQGRMFEDLIAPVMPNVDRGPLKGRVKLTGRQICIGHIKCADLPGKPPHEQGPVDFWLTGHTDGEFRLCENGNAEWLDLQATQFLNNLRRLEDGLIWGFSSKHLGRWKYEKIAKYGSIADAAPDYELQELLYGIALGWDASFSFISSQDASSVRSDASANLRAKNPEHRWATQSIWHPKLMDFVFDLRPLKPTLGALAKVRADWLTKWMEESGNPTDVAREFDPTVPSKNGQWTVDENQQPKRVDAPDFPCGWCPFLVQCLTDGQSGEYAPSLPFMGEHDFDD